MTPTLVNGTTTSAIRVRGLDKTFGNGRRVLDRVEFDVAPGEMVALIRASGSGTSTLLRHIAGLTRGDRFAGSRIEVCGRMVQAGGDLAPDIRAVRAGIGLVFQQFNLVERLPVLTNVLAGHLSRLPVWRTLSRTFRREEIEAGLEALRRVDIAECAPRRAATLSGGQQQRAAIARALVQRAPVVLADEPIASLDPESSRKVMEILSRINREDGCTVLVSLHQVNVAMRYCPRTIALRQGVVVYDGPSAGLTPATLRDLYGADAHEILSMSDAISSMQDGPSDAALHPIPTFPSAPLRAFN